MSFTVGTGQGVAFSGSGAMNVQSTPVGNVGTGEDDLHTFPVPASSLVVTNRRIRWEGEGTIANNANAKTLKVYFGAQMISCALPTNIAGHWYGKAKITRTGSSAQRYSVEVRVINTGTNAEAAAFSAQGTLTQTETAAITIKATGEATSNNDIVQNTSTVRFE